MIPSPSHDPLDRLFAVARTQRADTSATEYAFETRLLARLQSSRDETSLWARTSWRLAPFFAVCVVALALWQGELTSEANDAQQIAFVEGAAAPDPVLLD